MDLGGIDIHYFISNTYSEHCAFKMKTKDKYIQDAGLLHSIEKQDINRAMEIFDAILKSGDHNDTDSCKGEIHW